MTSIFISKNFSALNYGSESVFCSVKHHGRLFIEIKKFDFQNIFFNIFGLGKKDPQILGFFEYFQAWLRIDKFSTLNIIKASKEELKRIDSKSIHKSFFEKNIEFINKKIIQDPFKHLQFPNNESNVSQKSQTKSSSPINVSTKSQTKNSSPINVSTKSPLSNKLSNVPSSTPQNKKCLNIKTIGIISLIALFFLGICRWTYATDFENHQTVSNIDEKRIPDSRALLVDHLDYVNSKFNQSDIARKLDLDSLKEFLNSFFENEKCLGKEIKDVFSHHLIQYLLTAPDDLKNYSPENNTFTYKFQTPEKTHEKIRLVFLNQTLKLYHYTLIGDTYKEASFYLIKLLNNTDKDFVFFQSVQNIREPIKPRITNSGKINGIQFLNCEKNLPFSWESSRIESNLP